MHLTGLEYYGLSFKNHSTAIECLYLNKIVAKVLNDKNIEEYDHTICRILKHMDLELLKSSEYQTREPKVYDEISYEYFSAIGQLADIIEEVEVLNP